MAFESVTDIKIAELIAMPKRVSNPGSRSKTKEGHEQITIK